MKYFLWIITIVILVLLFPIPLKITLIYSKGIFTLKLYNKVIIPSESKKAKAKKTEKSKDYVETPNGEKISKFKIKDIREIVDFFINTKPKLSIRTKLFVEYAMDDAALNAIVYGLLYQISAIISTTLNMFFKVKNFDPCITNKYNENFFKFSSTSIIFINIAKVIFMIITIFYRFNKRRVHSSFKHNDLKEEF